MTITLDSWLDSYAGKTGEILGWDSEAGDYDFIVEAVLAVYGVTTEAEATDLNKLYSIAKVELWKAVLSNTAGMYNFSADGSSFSRSQIHEMALENLSTCLSEAIQYYSNYSIEVGEFTSEQNPYQEYPPYSERYK